MAIIILLIIAVITTAMSFFIGRKYCDLQSKYCALLDQYDQLWNDKKPSFDAYRTKMLNTGELQDRKMFKLLFTVLLDLINEEDEGVAIERLIELRDKANNMATSNSDYVKMSDRLINIQGYRDLSSIMYWLCSVFDVRGGKDNLSDTAKKTYIGYKSDIIYLQERLIKLSDEFNKQEESNYEEDYKENYEEYDQTEDEKGNEEDDEEYEEEEDIPPIKDLFFGIFKKNYR